MSCGVGHRHSLDPGLLWLWCRPAAEALIQPLAWEPPYAAGVALKKKKKKKGAHIFSHWSVTEPSQVLPSASENIPALLKEQY